MTEPLPRVYRRLQSHKPPRGMGPAFVLSILAHVLLVLAIAFAVRWNTQPVGPVSVELWGAPPVPEPPRAAPPQTAPPRPTPPQVAPPPPPPVLERPADIVLEPKKVLPPPEPEREEPKLPPPPDPEIEARRLAEAKAAEERRIAEAKAAEEKRIAEVEAKRVAEAKRIAEAKAAEEKRIAEVKAAEAKAAEAKAAEAKAAEAKAAEAKRVAEAKAAEAKRLADAKAAELKQAAERHAAELRRITAAAGSPTGVGISAKYHDQIVGCIRPHIVFNLPDGVRSGQHVAEFVVQLAPTGEQMGAPKLLKSSGLAAYDQAVERAIRRCDPFPRPEDGPMQRTLSLRFDPVETR